jgi:HD-like signal output (HDOD) protein/CheY-like chemotaxis protein
MRVMILEDDPWVADLLKGIAFSINSSIQIDCFDRVHQALTAWQKHSYQLVLAELKLPDTSSIDLLEQIRKNDDCTSLVIITGQADRSSVLSVRPFNVNTFITKPFQPQRIRECLEILIPHADEGTGDPIDDEDFSTYLAALAGRQLDLPMEGRITEMLLRYLKGEQLDVRELTKYWQHDAGLCARLIAVANSSAYNSSGVPSLSFGDALIRVGLHTGINLAMGMALRQLTRGCTPLVLPIIQAQIDKIESLGACVAILARQCDIDPPPLQTAALLHRMGELCVLHAAQFWENSGHTLDDIQINRAMSEFSGPFAISLKAHWGIPIAIRELIGAAHVLPTTFFRREQVVMRLAAAKVYGEDLAVIERLMRLSGLAPS